MARHKSIEEAKDIKEYRSIKLDILKDFGVTTTPEIKREMHKRATEMEIDQYYRALLNARFDD